MLTTQQIGYGVILLLLALAIAAFALTRWRLRRMRVTAGPGALLLWCGSAWIITNVFQLVSSDLLTAMTWGKIEYIVISPIPILWLILVLRLTNSEQLLTRRNLLLLALIPVASLIVLLTNDLHGLFISQAHLEYRDSVANLSTEAGPVMIIAYLYGYILVLFGAVHFARSLLYVRGYRWQASIVLFGFVLTVGANILDWSRLNPIPQFKLTPLALVFSIPVWVVTILHARRADIVPIARSKVIQIMQDAVLVLDTENRLIDMNPAAEEIVGRPLAEIFGKTIEETFPEWQKHGAAVAQNSRNSNRIEFGSGASQRILDIRQSELNDRHGHRISQVVVLRDITEQALAEAALQSSEARFRALTENATDSVVIVNEQGIISYASPSIEKTFGFARAKLIGANVRDFIHPDDLGIVVQALADAHQRPGMTSLPILRLRSMHGGWHKLECTANNLLDHPAVQGIVVNARNVTERVEAEEKLRLSEEYFRALTENSSDVTIIADMDGTLKYVSPALERIFGLNHVGTQPLEFVHPEDLDRLMTSLLDEFTGVKASTLVTARLRDVDGNWRTLEFLANNLLEHPAVHGIVVNARDVTERVEAEEKLRLSEEYFRALTEHSSDVTIITAMDGTIKYASPSLERVFGLTRENVVGKRPFEFIHPDDIEHLMTSMTEKRLGEEGSTSTTARARSVDGTWHILEFTSRNMLDHPAVQGVVVNTRDVTERETIAAALRESEERYRLHFANVNDVIFAYDTHLAMQSVSPSVERHLGIRPEDCLGRSILELGVVAPEYLEKAAVETMRALSGEHIENTEFEFVAKDGRRLTVEISVNPIFRDNEVIAVVNVARDITERVRTEEQIKASLAEKEILLKEIHHRVKNNLQIIVSLLSLQAIGTDNPLMLAQFQDSQNRVRSMALIHERLYRSNDLAHIDFGTYLRDLAEYLLNSYTTRNANIDLVVEADDVRLDIDQAVPCGLMVNELISNALKHAFPDERAGSVSVEMRIVNESYIQLVVGDNGVGFPEQVDYRTAASLGLQLVNSLARQLGGSIDVSKTPGTKFVIRFPKAVEQHSVPVERA